MGDGLSSDDESLENSNDSTEASDNLESFGAAVRSDDDDDDDDDDEKAGHPGSPQLRSLGEIAEMSRSGDDDNFLDNSHEGRRRRRGLKKDLA